MKLTIRQINPLTTRDASQSTCGEDFNLPGNIVLTAGDCQGIPWEVRPGETLSSDLVRVVWTEKICNLCEGIYDPGLDLTDTQWLNFAIVGHFVKM